MIRLAVLLLLPAFGWAASPPIVEAAYADDAAAAKAWKPLEGTPSAQVTTEADGSHALRLACPFSTFKGARAYWDHRVDLDLSGAEGIQIEMRCRHRAPIGHFNVYLETPSGWYNATLNPRRADQWTTVTVRKDAMKAEGKDGGLDRVRTIRLAAFRAADQDTAFEIRAIRRFGELGTDTDVILAAGQDRFDAVVGKQLEERGIRHAKLPATALTPANLAKAKLLILPYNPNLDEATTAAIEVYLSHGGKLLAFYTLPSRLATAAGLKPGKHLTADPKGRFASIHVVDQKLAGAPAVVAQASWNIVTHEPVQGRSQVIAEWFDDQGRATGLPAVLGSDNAIVMTHVLLDDDHDRKGQLLLAMVGRLRPATWDESFTARRRQLDEIADFPDYAAACAQVRALPGADDETRRRLEASGAAEASARQLAVERRFAEAFAETDRAGRLFQEAYCRAHPAPAGEIRGVWCHSAYGVKGRTWDDAVANLKANGFNTIMPNMLWGGVAFYPSEVLPVAPDVATKGDQIAECLAACRKHGLKIHVWKVDWNLGREVPAAFVTQLRAEHRLQMSDTGTEEPWLCPSDPRNAALERAALVEVARKYPVDGIHFDYIRYPDAKHCFCGPCRERFTAATGQPVARWPADVLAGGSRREAWIRWCQENINTVVRTTSQEVRKVRPGIQVSAAVFRQWDSDSRLVMQDWKRWCEQGWVDFVCPMDYTESEAGFAGWVSSQKRWVGPAGLLPGIGVSSSHSVLTPDEVVRQIEITRRNHTQGFILFNYGEREARETIPALGLGLTR
jgi:uncharacterized lipoprotein YddW (UPF0748 family)